MKKELNAGKAGMLAGKLIKDTEDNKLRWEKEPVSRPAEGKKTAGKMLKGYIYSADINDTLSAHVENVGGEVSVWVERKGERIYISKDLYENSEILSAVNKLHGLVKFYSNIQVMKEIDEYLGVPFDEKAYLITEDDED